MSKLQFGPAKFSIVATQEDGSEHRIELGTALEWSIEHDRGIETEPIFPAQLAVTKIDPKVKLVIAHIQPDLREGRYLRYQHVPAPHEHTLKFEQGHVNHVYHCEDPECDYTEERTCTC